MSDFEARSASPGHPEEIKAVVDLRIGNHVTLQASARITPAGVICSGIAAAAILLATAAVISASRSRRLPAVPQRLLAARHGHDRR